MKSKFLYTVILALGAMASLHSQLNAYKYIVVPKKFDAFKTENMHLTSTMVKHYFTENGFNAIYSDDLKADLVNDPCLGVTADLLDFSSLFFTKTIVILKDCEGKEVFRSIEGSSKQKEYIKAYKEALKESFVSFQGMSYAYTPKKQAKEVEKSKETITVSFKDDVKSVQELKEAQVVEQKATPEEQVYKSKKPVSSNMVKGDSSMEKEEVTNISEESTADISSDEAFVAVPVDNGYHIVDNSSNIVLKIQETSMQDIFLTEYKGNNAVLFKKENVWMLEYLEGGEKMVEEIQIKF